MCSPKYQKKTLTFLLRSRTTLWTFTYVKQENLLLTQKLKYIVIWKRIDINSDNIILMNFF